MVVFPFWKPIILLTVVVIISPLEHITGCVVKYDKEKAKALHGPWDYVEQKRSLKECECGTHVLSSGEKKPPPWNVYIHTKVDSSGPTIKTCTGTIINSKTILTSHKCLFKRKSMNLVDILKFKKGDHSLATKEDITVTTTSNMDAAGPTQKFPVTDIWYNPRFALTSELQHKNKSVKLEDDLVLIKVDADFGDTVCLQTYSDQVEDIYEKGFFYGFESEHEDEGGNSTVPASAITEEHVEIVENLVLRKSVCQNKPDSKDPAITRMFCFVYEHVEDQNTNVGGPLIVTSGQRSFLLGIASQIPDPGSFTGRDASVGMEHLYFTAVGPLVRFIEFFSNLDGSKWCKTPEFKVVKISKQIPMEAVGAMGSTDTRNEDGRPWPWENLKPPVARDEVLNCVCGEANTKIRGRVVGGVEATPREFGWMALLHLYPYGKSKGGALCGGSVINDRIILTAAHCVVVDKWLYEGKRKVAIDPKNVEVVLNAHERRGDPMGVKKEVSAVLFHPEYLNSRMGKPEYYDTDIALLVLKEPLQFTLNEPGTRPICLHKFGEYEDVVDRNAWVVGWGLTDPKDKSSAAEKLQKLEVPIAELSFCGNVARSKVTDNFLCAGTLNMYKDAARGDSGGPLQLEDTFNSQWYQVGAVSWGEDVKRGDETLTAALYADVQKLLPFVEYHARRLDAKWCKAKREDIENSPIVEN